MINIEKIEKQIKSLQRCIDNYRSSKETYENQLSSPYSTFFRIESCKSLMERTENTLKTQLRIMADDNREEIK